MSRQNVDRGIAKRLLASVAGLALAVGATTITAPPSAAADSCSGMDTSAVTVNLTGTSYTYGITSSSDEGGLQVSLGSPCGGIQLVKDSATFTTTVTYTGDENGQSILITGLDNAATWGGGFSVDLAGGTDVLTLQGGLGNDTLSYTKVTIVPSGLPGGTQLETLVLDGQGGDDILLGGPGAETLLGGSGSDSLSGGNGNDFLEGGPGSDTMDGGAGLDTVSYANSTVGVTATLNGAASGGDADTDTSVNFEALEGSGQGDTLNGTSANDVISGLAGDDVITGGRGSDTLNGGAGLDTLNGNGGNDNIGGGSGADTLLYGGGVDTFHGDTVANGDDDSCEGWVAGITDGSTGSKKYGRVTYWYCDSGI